MMNSKKVLGMVLLGLISVNGSKVVAQTTYLETTCNHPVRGKETCKLEPVESTNGFRIHWADNARDHVQHREANDELRVWNHATSTWDIASSIGFCWNQQKCVHFPVKEWEKEEVDLDGKKILTTCAHPVRGKEQCQLESVEATEGIRIYWQDGAKDHIRNFHENQNRPRIDFWSYEKNAWETSKGGMCFNDICILAFPDF